VSEPLKILVVEDEAVQRQALAAMCRKVLADRPVEVRDASDGARALELGREWPPDVVLMDIKMPTMDGLEAARRLASRPPRAPEMIFVTAYDDFSYAREALTLGASEYLLKPVSMGDLARVLAPAVERVEARRRAALRAARTTRRLKAAMPLLRLQAFRDLLDVTLTCPSETTPALDERLGLAGVSGQPCLALFFTIETGWRRKATGKGATGMKRAGNGSAGNRPTPQPAPENDVAGEAVAEQDVADGFGRTLRRRLGSGWLAGTAGPHRLGVFVRPPAGLGRDETREWALALAAELKAEAERLTGLEVSAGVGEAHPEEGGLGASIREAAQALHSRDRLGPGCLVHVADIHPHEADERPAPAPPPAAPLLDAIRLGELEEAGRMAGRIGEEIAFTSRGGGPRGRTERTRILFVELVALCGRAAIEGGADPEEVRSRQGRVLERITDASETAPAPGEMARVLADFARDCASLARTAHSQRQCGVVKRALAYMQANFDRALTLEGVAREVHVSPYYLSHLLSRESNGSFTEHLAAMRMARARQLLASSDLSVGEVAARVGFSDGNYFARVFKRETGVTPSSYRRRAREGKPEAGPGPVTMKGDRDDDNTGKR